LPNLERIWVITEYMVGLVIAAYECMRSSTWLELECFILFTSAVHGANMRVPGPISILSKL
jgi:hypothetical protein